MSTEAIAFIGAALMVALAYVAYRYWRSTATFARQVRESHAQRALESYRVAAEETPIDVQSEDQLDLEMSPDEPEVAAGSADETDEREPRIDSVDVDEPAAEQTPDEAGTGGERTTQPAEQPPAAGDQHVRDDDHVLDDTADDIAEAGSEVDHESLAPELRLIEELEPRTAAVPTDLDRAINERLRELDEEIAGLPSGVELIDLPILERRRVADRRQELMNDRASLLEQRKRGAHRRRRRGRRNPRNG